jgi:N utilization substance protein A
MNSSSNDGVRSYGVPPGKQRGLGPGSAGQSGDTQGLPDVAEAGSESVEELIEEGQFFEAEAILGVEGALDADVSEVHTREVPEDDVPSEYAGRDDPQV